MSGSIHLIAQGALLEAGRPDLAEKIDEHDDTPETDLTVWDARFLPEPDALLLHRAIRIAQLAAGVPMSVCAACWVAGLSWREDENGSCLGVPPSLELTDCGASRERSRQ